MFLAAEGQGGGGSSASLLIMMLLLFGAMYFLFIRPNKRRRQQVEQMQASIGVGDEVLTIGGLYGVVEEIDDDRVVLEVAPGVTNRYTRAAIGQVVNAAPRADEPDDDSDLDDTVVDETTAKKVIDTD